MERSQTRGMSTMKALSATLHGRAGKDFVMKVRGTLAGRMAEVLDQLLYDCYEHTFTEGMDKGHTCLRLPVKVRIGVRDGSSEHDNDIGIDPATHEVESRRLLRDIFHFLEATAFAEVISNP